MSELRWNARSRERVEAEQLVAAELPAVDRRRAGDDRARRRRIALAVAHEDRVDRREMIGFGRGLVLHHGDLRLDLRLMHVQPVVVDFDRHVAVLARLRARHRFVLGLEAAVHPLHVRVLLDVVRRGLRDRMDQRRFVDDGQVDAVARRAQARRLRERGEHRLRTERRVHRMLRDAPARINPCAGIGSFLNGPLSSSGDPTVKRPVLLFLSTYASETA